MTAPDGVDAAGNVMLLAFAAERRPCSNRSISAGRRAHSRKPAAAASGGRMMGQTDRQTDRRTLYQERPQDFG